VMALTVKLLLALCAFGIAILGIADVKSLADTDQNDKIPWYRRLTSWGYAKIGFAIATLLLGGLNEYLTATEAEAG
jgi:hypothetical protein